MDAFPDFASDLQKLHRLHQQGIISDVKYERIQDAILTTLIESHALRIAKTVPVHDSGLNSMV